MVIGQKNNLHAPNGRNHTSNARLAVLAHPIAVEEV